MIARIREWLEEKFWDFLWWWYGRMREP